MSTYTIHAYVDGEGMGTVELTDEQFRQYMDEAQQPQGLMRYGDLPGDASLDVDDDLTVYLQG